MRVSWPSTGRRPASCRTSTEMPEFLQYGFMQRALVVGAVTALICPAIGVFLIPRRLSLIADTLSHVALAGVALGLLIGVSPVLGALVVTVAGAVGMERLRARGALQGDAALAVFLSGGFALAVVLISLARGFNADLFAILFGSILTVTTGDVWLIVALGAVVTLAIGGFYRQLLAITLHEDLARTSGVPVAALNLLLTLLTALTTVVVNIAKQWFTISDLADIYQHRIGFGRIGGKSAGMLLADRILKDVASEGLKPCIRIPESFFLGS